jgi:hypothetical protein
MWSSVVLDASGPTTARVRKAGGELVEGVRLEVRDGRAVVTRG